MECLCTGHGPKRSRDLQVEYLRHDESLAAQGLSTTANWEVDFKSKCAYTRLVLTLFSPLQLTISPSHEIFLPILNRQLSLRPTWSLELLHLLILVRAAPILRLKNIILTFCPLITSASSSNVRLSRCRALPSRDKLSDAAHKRSQSPSILSISARWVHEFF